MTLSGQTAPRMRHHPITSRLFLGFSNVFNESIKITLRFDLIHNASKYNSTS